MISEVTVEITLGPEGVVAAETRTGEAQAVEVVPPPPEAEEDLGEAAIWQAPEVLESPAEGEELIPPPPEAEEGPEAGEVVPPPPEAEEELEAWETIPPPEEPADEADENEWSTMQPPVPEEEGRATGPAE
jgi:hypothetical protein